LICVLGFDIAYQQLDCLPDGIAKISIHWPLIPFKPANCPSVFSRICTIGANSLAYGDAVTIEEVNALPLRSIVSPRRRIAGAARQAYVLPTLHFVQFVVVRSLRCGGTPAGLGPLAKLGPLGRRQVRKQRVQLRPFFASA
jgi:hypothetical protein